MRKLVRDRIPDHIKAQSESVPSGLYDEIGYRLALLDKLVEEAMEAREAQSQKQLVMVNNNHDLVVELADIQEVVEAICGTFGITPSDIEEQKLRKRAKKGAFSRGAWCEFKVA
jgi:predicted house-cleaning noncanonical NTP pyrophosphatase (MazG superfamily)